MYRLQGVLDALGGDVNKLVIDLSCRRKEDKWVVAMNRWQTLTDMEVNQGALHYPHPQSPSTRLPTRSLPSQYPTITLTIPHYPPYTPANNPGRNNHLPLTILLRVPHPRRRRRGALQRHRRGSRPRLRPVGYDSHHVRRRGAEYVGFEEGQGVEWGEGRFDVW